jgi:hypothetical protein
MIITARRIYVKPDPLGIVLVRMGLQNPKDFSKISFQKNL